MPLDRERSLASTERTEEAQAGASVITFEWGEDLYGVPLAEVREIAKVGSITPFPGLPAALLGAVNLRGEVLPVVDLRGFLNLEPGRPTNAARLIIVAHHAERVGLLVDSVGDVLEVPALERSTAPSDLVTGQTVLPAGRLLTVVDVRRALAALTTR